MTSIPSAFRALATRWPPEISPGSTALLSGNVVASAAGVVVALTVGGLLGPVRRLVPAAYGSLSVQVVDRVFHVVGQVQCVISDETLGELAVASLEGLDDVHVVDDRALGPVVLADGPASDRSHVHEQVLDQLQEQRRLRQLDDALVEAQVGHRVLVEVRPHLAVLEVREQGAEGADVLRRRPLARHPGGHALQGRPDPDHLDDLGLALADDVDAPPRHDAHQALVLESRERLTDGGAAHAEIGGKALLVEPQVGIRVVDVHPEDAVAQRLVGQLADARLGAQRRNDQSALQLLGNELGACRLVHHHVQQYLSTRRTSSRSGRVVCLYTRYQKHGGSPARRDVRLMTSRLHRPADKRWGTTMPSYPPPRAGNSVRSMSTVARLRWAQTVHDQPGEEPGERAREAGDGAGLGRRERHEEDHERDGERAEQ